MFLRLPQKESNPIVVSTFKTQYPYHVAVHLLDASIRWNHFDVFGIVVGEFQITVPDLRVELDIFHLKPALIVRALLIAGARTRQADLRRNIEQHSDLGAILAADQIGEFADELQRNTASIALV